MPPPLAFAAFEVKVDEFTPTMPELIEKIAPP